MPCNLADLFEGVVSVRGEREAVVCGTDRLTYADLDERASERAAAFLELGAEPGSTIGLMLRNGVEYLAAMLGAFKIRAIPVNINYHYVADELRPLLLDVDPSIVLCETDLRHRVEDALDTSDISIIVPGDARLRAALTPDRPTSVPGRSGDDLYLLYTGGTTGPPKGVLWRHEDLFRAALCSADTDRYAITAEQVIASLPDRGIRVLPASPLMHGTAQWVSLMTLFSGGTVIVDPTPNFDPRRTLELVERERASFLVIVGDAFALPILETLEIERGHWDVASLTVIVNGGATLSPRVREAILNHLFGAIVVDSYGTSEAGGRGRRVLTPGQTDSGPPTFMLTDDTAVVGEALELIGPGGVGRIASSGPLPIGYYNDPEATDRAFRTAHGRRWSVSGDVARVEDDGSVTLLGRAERLINTGGEKVYPVEVEVAVATHPAVLDVVVVGAPDERFGHRVTALVELHSGTDLGLDELVAHCRTTVAGFKVPRSLVIVDRVRRSAVGKPDYRWAAEIARDSG